MAIKLASPDFGCSTMPFSKAHSIESICKLSFFTSCMWCYPPFAWKTCSKYFKYKQCFPRVENGYNIERISKSNITFLPCIEHIKAFSWFSYEKVLKIIQFKEKASRMDMRHSLPPTCHKFTCKMHLINLNGCPFVFVKVPPLFDRYLRPRFLCLGHLC